MMEKIEPLTISPAECAKLLGISRPKVYDLINQGGFPSFKIGSRTHISVDGLRQWIAKQVEVVSL